MIVGNGLVGQSLQQIDRSDILFFASGVSNSKTDSQDECSREEKLLVENINQHQDKTFVYFSTISILDPSLIHYLYIQHKQKMEQLIQDNARNYLIVRTSNIIGKTKNANTVMNYFCNAILNQTQIEIWGNSYRNILDVDDLCKMVSYVLQNQMKNQIVVLVNPIEHSASDVVKSCEFVLQKKAITTFSNKGAKFNYDKEFSAKIFLDIGINIEHYIERAISKYITKT